MKLVILGAGESGAGTAILAQKQGYEVFVSDMGQIKDKYKKVLDDHNIRWEEGKHTEAEILSATEVVKSPGIPDTAPMVKKLIEQNRHEDALNYYNSAKRVFQQLGMSMLDRPSFSGAGR